MNLAEILKLKFPGADFMKEIRLADEGYGPFIRYWDEEVLGCSKPTEAELKQFADEVDLDYRIMKVLEQRHYPSLGEQLDMLYHDKINNTTVWLDTIKAIKDANPKPTE